MSQRPPDPDGHRASGPADWLTQLDEQLARTNDLLERQNELLADVGQPTIDVGDVDERTLARATRQEFTDLWTGAQVVWPGAGDPFSFPSAPDPATPIRGNLVTGKVDLAGITDDTVNPTLASVGEDRALSANIWADADLVLKFFDENDRQVGHFTHDQLTYTRISGVPTTRVEIVADTTFEMQAQMSAGLVPPRDTHPVATTQRRLAIHDTGDSFAPVRWGPPGLADDLGIDGTQTALDLHGVQTKLTKHVGQAVYVVENTTGNDAEVQLRHRDVDGEQWAADDDVHTSPDLTNFVTVAANDFDVLETSITSRVKQLRARSATAGQSATVRCQYHGYAPGVR